MPDFKLFIVAGEPSGDIHAAGLVRELIKREAPRKITLLGTGGAALAELGQKQTATVSELAVIGFVEAIKKLPFFLRLAKRLEAQIAQERPDVVLLIDYTSFNLRFARKIKKYNIPVIQFTAPQVWIWHYSRVKTLAAYFDRVLCLLPFEEDLLKKEGVNAVYIGHPAADTLIITSSDRGSFCKRFNLSEDKPLIAIAPGSRLREINYLMPVIVAAAAALKAKGFEANFILAKANSVSRQLIESYIPRELDITVVEGDTPTVFKYADLIWICSGTATLEAGILGTPMIILYKAPKLDVLIIKALTKLRLIALPNIILGSEVVPEVKDNICTSKNLEEKTIEALNKGDDYRRALSPLKDMFAGRSPFKNGAEEVLKVIKSCGKQE
ncbi:MAG: lipid-A-disaccharide synthase [Deferribacteraceae bacterium]|jgi:lipid-A-disaccharide synthase|nr:lipid-A-disaccharide synthase [Deferribacteraceae bacterium]